MCYFTNESVKRKLYLMLPMSKKACSFTVLNERQQSNFYKYKKSLGKSNSPWKLSNKSVLDKKILHSNSCFGRVKSIQLENK